MRRFSTAIIAIALLSCSPKTTGEDIQPTQATTSSTPTPSAATPTPSAATPTPATPSAAASQGKPMTSETFLDLVLTLPPGYTQRDDKHEEQASRIPGAQPTIEYFRSYTRPEGHDIYFFGWDGFPMRDRGPMQAIESWKVRIGEIEANISRTSLFFGIQQEVLVAHFEGPPPAKHRYMIYTKRVDKEAFNALLQAIRFK